MKLHTLWFRLLVAKIHCISLTILATGLTAQGQGNFVYDQQSATDDLPSYAFGVPAQAGDSFGQSFTPSLSAVGFIRLHFADSTPGDGQGASLSVNLRAVSITGPILASTTPVALAGGFAGSVNSFFPSTVPVTPGTTYFFEIVLQPTANWAFFFTGGGEPTGPDYYLDGVVYVNGTPARANVDLLFREGIVVPEPASAWLLLVGAACLVWLRRRNGPAAPPQP